MSDLDDLTRECERKAGYPTPPMASRSEDGHPLLNTTEVGESPVAEIKRLRLQVSDLLEQRDRLMNYIEDSDSVKRMIGRLRGNVE